MSQSTPLAVSARDLVRSYPIDGGSFKALAGVSLDVCAGEFLGIMGPSGSGKSSLLYMLGCLDRPTSGHIDLEGTPVAGLDDPSLSRIRNERIGFVFQSFNLLPTSTIVANVELPMVYRGVPAAERRRRAGMLLEAVGLGTKLTVYPRQLSGGQMQRVAIARALANRPTLLLADEPTGNLDSQTGREIMQLFVELNRLGLTILMVTHDARIAAYTHRVVEVIDGQIVDIRVNDEPVREPLPEEFAGRLASLLKEYGTRGKAAGRGPQAPGPETRAPGKTTD